jgi:hypothetical protein
MKRGGQRFCIMASRRVNARSAEGSGIREQWQAGRIGAKSGGHWREQWQACYNILQGTVAACMRARTEIRDTARS